MTCPICGCRTRITNSRHHPDGIRRRRECVECGDRFTTLEVERDELVALRSEASAPQFGAPQGGRQ